MPDLSSIDLMLATNAPPFSRQGWIFEFKFDGYRIAATKEQLMTRNKKDFTARFPEVLQSLQKLRGNFILDGEVCLVDASGIPNFEAMLGGRKDGLQLAYFVFDLLFLNGRDLRGLPLFERKARLRKLIPKDQPRVGYVDYFDEGGELFYQHAIGIGMEGVVGKRADSHYVGGKTRDWLKVKPSGLHDGWKRRKAG